MSGVISDADRGASASAITGQWGGSIGAENAKAVGADRGDEKRHAPPKDASIAADVDRTTSEVAWMDFLRHQCSSRFRMQDPSQPNWFQIV